MDSGPPAAAEHRPEAVRSGPASSPPAPAPAARRIWSGEELQRWLNARPGETVAFALADGRKARAVLKQLRVQDGRVIYAAGSLSAPEAGTFFFQRQTVAGLAGDFVGIVEFPGSGTAFRLEPGADGRTEMVARPLADVKCIGLPPPADAQGARGAAAPAGDPQAALKPNPESGPVPQTPDYQGGVPALESLPGSTPVLYLDFDGEYTPTWGGIDAAPSGMGNGSISDCWRRVSADFLPYNINVTTDRRVFDQAPEGRRQMTIFTTTDDAAPGAGGVSYIGSFNWSGNTPNWVFVLNADSGAEAASHENGHALGLGHDGQTNNVEYYGGHGSGEFNWAPIMGVGYGANVSQWCKGEYAMADNRQDDLNIIDANNNSVAYRADEHGSNYVTASWLEIHAGNRVTNEGIVARNTDVDAFKFSTAGGAVDLTIGTFMAEKQIAYVSYLTDTNNAIVGTFDSTTSLAVRVVTNLAAGDYCLRVQGDGRNNPTNGFSHYASLGYYKITGTMTGGEQPRRFTIAENSTNGTIVGTITNSSPADPHAYRITGGNTGTAFAVSSNGVLTVASTNPINYEVREQIDLLVTVSNTANPALDETGVRVVVHITNVNEPPVFKSAGPFVVFEGTERGAHVGSVNATDPDDYTRLNYSIAAGNSNTTFALNDLGEIHVTNTVLRPANTNFSLLLRAVDQAGANAKTGTLTVVINVLSNVAPTANGGAAYSHFGNIGSSMILSGLTNHARWPHDPDYVTLLPSAEAPTDQADNYGAVMRAWLQVPFNGNYQFAIAGDDAFELRLSTNGVPTNATRIAYGDTWTNPREWTKYASQRSAAINLQVGRLYYLEARMKEGSGGDHLAVAWSNAALGVGAFTVIEGQYLAPYFIDGLPPPWQGRDIGDVGSPGLASFFNGRFTVSGAGADIWGTNDQFQLVSMPFTGDGTLSARVTAQQASQPFAKSGVMFRDTTAGNATFFDVLATPSNGVAMQYRTTTGGSSSGTTVANLVPPVWVRATRAGNTFRGYYSTNGDTWTQLGSAQTITMTNPLEAGLCVTAHDNSDTNITDFSNASVLPPGFDDDDIGAPGAPGGAWYGYNLGTWSVLGSGTDIYGTADRFHFVHAPAPGDCTLTARVLTVQRTDGNAKAGVMLRDSTASNAAHAFAFATPTNVWFQYRTNTAASTAAGSFANVAPPVWVKLVRRENSCGAFYSADGTNWTQLGSNRNINLAPTAVGGLAVTSHSNLTNSLATFEGFALAPTTRNFVWTNAPDGRWSDGPGWTNQAAPDPGGSRDYALVMAAAAACAVTNDLQLPAGGGFVLNALAITQNVCSLHGGALVFRSSSSNAGPVLWNTTTGSAINAEMILSNSLTITGNSGQTLAMNGTLGGTGLLTKSGNLTLVLNAPNGHGATWVGAGTLQLAGAGTFGDGPVTNNGTLSFARTGTYTVANVLSGTGGITKSTDNNGNLMLTGTNSFTGGVTVNNGAITVFNGLALGAGTKTLVMTAGTAGNPNLRLDGGNGAITLGTNITFQTSNAGGSVFNVAGTNAILGRFTLTSGGGDTKLVSQAGRLTAAGAMNFTANNRNLVLGGAGDGVILGAIGTTVTGAQMGVTKVDGGAWTLAGTNTFPGATVVNAGTLLVQGSLSTGAVTVAAGATLGGAGLLGGAVTASGTIRPGDDAPGVLTCDSNATFLGTAKFAVRLGGYAPGGDHDRLVIGGTAILAGSLVPGFTNGFENQVTNGAAFTVLEAGSLTGTFANATNGAEFVAGLGALVVTNTPTNLVLTYRASRPPWSTWQLLHFGCTNCVQAGEAADPDGDGMDNGREWISGTVPTNAASLLRVVALAISNNNVVVTWNAVSNRDYVVQGGLLTNAPASLTTVHVPPDASLTQTNFTQAGGATNASGFYWIRLTAP